tara:strand:- start:1112 stop:1468 length:357 start_codon:yes stop_codon:yes gene_type:complete
MAKAKAKPKKKVKAKPKAKVKAKAKPKAKKKAKPAKLPKPIGVVSNFFDHISVAAIKLTAALKVGDKIRFKGGESTDFEQKVKSMQVQHDKVEKAKKGEEIGIKTSGKVRKGYKVFKA